MNILEERQAMAMQFLDVRYLPAISQKNSLPPTARSIRSQTQWYWALRFNRWFL